MLLQTTDQLTIECPLALACRVRVRRHGDSNGHGDFSQMWSQARVENTCGKHFMEKVLNHWGDQNHTVGGTCDQREMLPGKSKYPQMTRLSEKGSSDAPSCLTPLWDAGAQGLEMLGNE